MELRTILSHVDHTLLKQDATWEQIKTIVDEGIAYGAASVCIPASYVHQAAEYAHLHRHRLPQRVLHHCRQMLRGRGRRKKRRRRDRHGGEPGLGQRRQVR